MIKRPSPIKIPTISKYELNYTLLKCNNCQTPNAPILGAIPYYCELCTSYDKCDKCDKCDKLPTPCGPVMMPRVLCEDCNNEPKEYYECELCNKDYKQLYKMNDKFLCKGCYMIIS